MDFFNKIFLTVFALAGFVISGSIFAFPPPGTDPKFAFAVYNNSSFILKHHPPDVFTFANWCNSSSMPTNKILPGEETPVIETCNNNIASGSFDSTVFYGYDENDNSNGCYIKLSCARVDSQGLTRWCGRIQVQDTPIQCVGTAQAQITNEIFPNEDNQFIGFTTVTISYPNKGDRK